MAAFLKSLIGETIPLLTTSQFYETGCMTPDEFIRAGDQLVSSCSTWQWAAGDPAQARSYLPKDKQYLLTRNVPSTRRANTFLADGREINVQVQGDSAEDVDDWTLTHAEEKSETFNANGATANTTSNNDGTFVTAEAADDIPELQDSDDEDTPGGIVEDDDASALRQAARAGPDGVIRVSEPEDKFVRTRTYDISIVYDRYYRTPRVYLLGYDEAGQPLTHDQITQDISADHAGKTVTQEQHPLTGVPNLSIHPCRHASTVKRLLDAIYERELEVATEAQRRQEELRKAELEEKEKDMSKWRGLISSTGGDATTTPTVATVPPQDIATKALKEKMPVENYMFLFLKFIASVIPTIEYDYTISMNL